MNLSVKVNKKLGDLKNIYEEMRMDNQPVLSSVKNNINFQLMRQAFISPVELPIMTESFLRRDFNFSMYLGY